MIASLTKETTAHCCYLRGMGMTNQLVSLYHSLFPNIRLFLMMKWNLIYHYDIFLIQDFIQVNRQLICNLADYTISQREFFDNVVKV